MKSETIKEIEKQAKAITRGEIFFALYQGPKVIYVAQFDRGYILKSGKLPAALRSAILNKIEEADRFIVDKVNSLERYAD